MEISSGGRRYASGVRESKSTRARGCSCDGTSTLASVLLVVWKGDQVDKISQRQKSKCGGDREQEDNWIQTINWLSMSRTLTAVGTENRWLPSAEGEAASTWSSVVTATFFSALVPTRDWLSPIRT